MQKKSKNKKKSNFKHLLLIIFTLQTLINLSKMCDNVVFAMEKEETTSVSEVAIQTTVESTIETTIETTTESFINKPLENTTTTVKDELDSYCFNLFFTSNLYGEEKIPFNELNNYLTLNKASLVFDTGNFSMEESSIYKTYLNKIIYNYINVASKEISLGQSYLNSLLEIYDKNILLSSSLVNENGDYIFKPYAFEKINIKDGLSYNLGIISLVDPNLFNEKNNDNNSNNISKGTINILTPSKAYSEALRKIHEDGLSPNLFTLLYDGDLNDDLYKFLDENKEVDILIINSKEVINTNYKGTYIISTGSFFNNIGKISLEFNVDKNSKIDNIFIDSSIISKEEINTINKNKANSSDNMDGTNCGNNINLPKEILKKEVKIVGDLTTSAKEDSTLPDLINNAYISHALGFLGDVNNLISVCNVKVKNYTIAQGNYVLENIADLFIKVDHPILINLTVGDFKKILNSSYNNLPNTIRTSTFNLGQDFPLSKFDFYDNLSFNINPNNGENKRIENIKNIEGQNIDYKNDNDLIYLFITKERLNELINQNILDKQVLENNVIWDKGFTTADLVVNYLSNLDENTYHAFKNNNWTLKGDGIENFGDLNSDKYSKSDSKRIINKREITRNYDLESPTGKFILNSVKEEKNSNVAIIKKEDLKDSLPQGEISKTSIENLTIKPLSVIDGKISGSELKELVKNDFIKNSSIEVVGLVGSYSNDDDKNRVLTDVKLSDGSEIVDDKNYDISVITADTMASNDSLNDLLANNISKKEEINYEHTNSFSVGPKLMAVSSETKAKETSQNDEKIKISTKTKDNKTQSTDEKYALKNTKSSTNTSTDDTLTLKKGKDGILPNAGSYFNFKYIYLGILLILMGLYIKKGLKQ